MHHSIGFAFKSRLARVFRRNHLLNVNNMIELANIRMFTSYFKLALCLIALKMVVKQVLSSGVKGRLYLYMLIARVRFDITDINGIK